MDIIVNYLQPHIIQLSITIGLVLFLILVRSLTLRLVRKHGNKNSVAVSREVYVRKLITITLILLFATLIGTVWEVSVKGLSVYFASIFTIVGVALFATWSVLSNMTASVILFFFFPYRIGNTIKIIDGDNSVEGIISDITLFYIVITDEEGKSYSYPNNLVIQKPVKFA
ncbi:mechanosensitive ion channel [Fulvivirga sp. M361]|uniref:mechanosensitive ion channel domain-containing protein n=1 Tax=Fulvivirga sp. M361 TaxID=2594266 RepID=UPI00117BB4D7|nr:mechanosensitive ion channel domain-containing protein [Fulvivirga sp. M361]TRX60479.1 mechanosensitive ion channel [Fulvivirga sp. M361]